MPRTCLFEIGPYYYCVLLNDGLILVLFVPVDPAGALV
jgi:hypothetical protein